MTSIIINPLHCHSPPPDIRRRIEEHRIWLETAGQNGVRFDGRGQEFQNLDLMNIDLSLARLTGAYIVECNLRNAWLLRAELDGAHLVESHFDGARFDGARMLGTRLMGSRYPGATFEGQAFDHIVWTERDFDFYEVMSEENTLWLLRRYGEVDVEESLQYWRQRKGGKNPPSPTDEFAPTW